ncbi:PREDICTED: major royal jelly protein 3-like [Wasmannia auropunctata]|uniref:major royal jelly protein 3-like n=1 Tax=Wasmannia auropunctata TaxID=64793 RepID=UPI0005EED02E|nr:PREDICTED: major royal jelly protein 3-like [Wasmannia auropunctata]
MRHFLLALLILSTAIVSFGLEVNVIKKWKFVDFAWDSPEQKQQAIKSGRYNQSKCLLYDVNKAADGRLFGTLPSGLGPGSPATLATVTNKTGPGGPLLRPYPDWNWYNRSCRCEGILNVYRVHIQCNYIFVLDNGKNGPNQTCNPKLLIFDLKDDTLVQTIYIPLNIATNQTGSGLLIAPYVYIASGKCDRFLDEMIVSRYILSFNHSTYS